MEVLDGVQLSFRHCVVVDAGAAPGGGAMRAGMSFPAFSECRLRVEDAVRAVLTYGGKDIVYSSQTERAPRQSWTTR